MKRLLSLILIAVMLTAAAMPLYAANTTMAEESSLPFTDVKKNAWYYDEVEFCFVNGVVNGMDKDSYAPTKALTRAQFVTLLAQLENASSGYTVDKFIDVRPNAWYYKAVAWATNKGIVSGTADDRFSPNATLTRETLATMMANYMKWKKLDVTVDDKVLDAFGDVSAISDWALDGVKYLVSAGIMQGTSTDKVSPNASLTRAQAARVIAVYLESYVYADCKHEMIAASCTAASSCRICKMVKGLALGHTTDNGNCSRCGEKQYPNGFEMVKDVLLKDYKELKDGAYIYSTGITYSSGDLGVARLSYFPKTDRYSLGYSYVWKTTGSYVDFTIWIDELHNAYRFNALYYFEGNTVPVAVEGYIDPTTVASGDPFFTFKNFAGDSAMRPFMEGIVAEASVNCAEAIDFILSDLCDESIESFNFTGVSWWVK